jgi:hypothetical protein
MEPLQDWRSSQFENELSRLDRGGVSFEFLRRNRQYRQDYAAALTEIAAGGTTRTEAIAASRAAGVGVSRRTPLHRPSSLVRWQPTLFPAVAIVTAAPTALQLLRCLIHGRCPSSAN